VEPGRHDIAREAVRLLRERIDDRARGELEPRVLAPAFRLVVRESTGA